MEGSARVGCEMSRWRKEVMVEGVVGAGWWW